MNHDGAKGREEVVLDFGRFVSFVVSYYRPRIVVSFLAAPGAVER
jgi:hypothetical protein